MASRAISMFATTGSLPTARKAGPAPRPRAARCTTHWAKRVRMDRRSAATVAARMVIAARLPRMPPGRRARKVTARSARCRAAAIAPKVTVPKVTGRKVTGRKVPGLKATGRAVIARKVTARQAASSAGKAAAAAAGAAMAAAVRAAAKALSA